MRKQKGIFLFNIIPIYRPGMSDVFDQFKAASLPSSGQRTKQNTLFESLENICGACIEDLDLLYIFATDGDSDYAKINWVQPGTFQLSQSGTVTHTPNSDFQGNGTTGYLDTGYIASTHATSYAQNDASVFCAIMNDVGENRVDFGVNSGGSDPSILFQSRNNTNQLVYRINVATQTGGASTASNGFWQISRQSSLTSSSFKNGSLFTSNSSGSSGIPDRTLPLLANNSNGTIGTFSTKKMGMFGLGASLSGQESALYSAWNTYFTSL